MQAADDTRHELTERAVFPMGAFGYRTRYDRILNESNRSWMSGEIRQRLAEHVVRKAGLGGDADKSVRAPLTMRGETGQGVRRSLEGAKALRLVRTVWPVGNDELALPAGEWNPPPMPEVPSDFRQVLGTYKLVGGQVIEVPRKAPTPQVARPTVRRPIQPPASPGGPIRPRLPVVVRPLPQRGGGAAALNVQPGTRGK